MYFVLFIAVCLFWTILLVWAFKYSVRFDKTIDPAYHERFPAISNTISSIKVLPRYIVLSTLLALVFLWVWNQVAARTGWPPIPAVRMSDFKGSGFFHLERFWIAASCAASLVGLVDGMRCLAKPVRAHWDVFISYKSEDVEIARRVADLLIASGYEVWFAEYQVLLKNYDKFQQAIDQGITNCDYGIAFTNDRYAKSPYCGLEITQLLDHLPHEKILEIMIPTQEPLTHQRYDALENCPRFVGSDLGGIVNFIQQHTGWDIASLPSEPVAPPRMHPFQCLYQPANLDITHWELKKAGNVVAGNTDVFLLEYLHERDHFHLFVNVICGAELSRQGQREDPNSDDRALAKFLREYSKMHLRRIKARVHGLHLLFHKSYSQFALTYFMHNYWTRKYSVIIPNPTAQKMAEFVFTFGFMGSEGDYCFNAYLMDRLVKSLQWN